MILHKTDIKKKNPGKQCKDTHVFSQIMKMQIINILLHK